MNWEIVGVVAEVVGAAAVVVSLIYLARQVRTSNRLARAEAYRSPNSDLNTLNAAFSIDPVFRQAFRRAIDGATRKQLEPDERTVLDGYLISVTNIYEQLDREIREEILDSESLGFGAHGLFELPYFRISWGFYRQNLGSRFVESFEARFSLDPLVEVEY
jgi:hypothetical protein